MVQNNLSGFIWSIFAHLLRRKQDSPSSTPKVIASKGNSEVFNRVLAYMEKNLCLHLTIEQICRDNMIGRSQLQKIFQQKTGLGVIEYFSNMKIDAAKQMMRTDLMNFTQIAEKLAILPSTIFQGNSRKSPA